jgi:hypothetical protein
MKIERKKQWPPVRKKRQSCKKKKTGGSGFPGEEIPGVNNRMA